MKCTRCGYENKDSAAVCNLCGELLRRTGGTAMPLAPSSVSSPVDYPNPTAWRTDTASPSEMLDILEEQDRHAAQKAKKLLIAAAGGLILIIAAWLISRLPYSPEKVDARYARYVELYPSEGFPANFTGAFKHPRRDANYLFQIAHAYETTFRKENPHARLDEDIETRLRVVRSGGADPGATYKPDAEATAALEKKIDNVEAVTRGLTPAGGAPFNTLRSLAGGDERGAEMRDLQMEEVHGRKEMAIRYIENERDNQRNFLNNVEKKTRDELDYLSKNGSPKIRSIARRLQQRLFGE